MPKLRETYLLDYAFNSSEHQAVVTVYSTYEWMVARAIGLINEDRLGRNLIVTVYGEDGTLIATINRQGVCK